MERGRNIVEGWPAVAFVGGVGLALLIASAVLFARARVLGTRRARAETYREEPRRPMGESARSYAWLLLAMNVMTQLIYGGVWLELVRWSRGSEPPRLSMNVFFWVLLVTLTSAGGALAGSWSE